MRVFTILSLSSVFWHPSAHRTPPLPASAVVQRDTTLTDTTSIDTTSAADPVLPLLTEPLMQRYVALRQRITRDSTVTQALQHVPPRRLPLLVGTIPGVSGEATRDALANIHIALKDIADLKTPTPVTTYCVQAKLTPQAYFAVQQALVFAVITERASADLADLAGLVKGAAPAPARTVMDQNVVFVQTHPALVAQAFGNIQETRQMVDQLVGQFRPAAGASSGLVP